MNQERFDKLEKAFAQMMIDVLFVRALQPELGKRMKKNLDSMEREVLCLIRLDSPGMTK